MTTTTTTEAASTKPDLCHCTSIEHVWGIPGCQRPDTAEGRLGGLLAQLDEREIDPPKKLTKAAIHALIDADQSGAPRKETTDAGEQVTIDLRASKAGLLHQCEQLGIDVPDGATKADVIELLRNYEPDA